MADCDDGGASRFGFLDHADDNGTVFRVERRGRFVQQQDRVRGDETAGDIDALLLAAGKCRGRYPVHPARDI